MKRISRLFNSLPKRLFALSLFGLAIALPAASLAADTVRMEGAMGVANVTAGDNKFVSEVNASYDQVVKFEVFYHNQENPDSGKVAQNVRVKIDIPEAASQTQVARSTISADNANTLQKQATVHLDRADASLQYIPGSAVWKHNTGTNEAPTYVEQKISDEVVLGDGGMFIENEKPCFNFSATITVLARVRIPGVNITKQVRVKGTTQFATENTAKPGETLEYLISYQNTGNTQQNNVVIRDNLPPKMTYVPGTTFLANQVNPNGVKYNSDAVTTTGIVVGNYGPSANAFVKFEVKVPNEDQLACGTTLFRNVGVVRPEGMNEFYNTAATTVEKKCAPNQPKYSCDLLDITKGSDRKVTISKFTTTATNGATFKDAVINWGDNTTPLTTNTAVGQSHTYAADGTYTISATARFEVNGQIVTASSANCVKSVTFSTTPTTPTTPSELPKTGAGDALGIFTAVTIAGTAAHRLFLGRRFTRG